ncbi:MAG: hypothetical protein OXB88_11070 [Bacteriovoracales bacterium]|nr:hypothetical protein [Bacteriovoracales bacterium]
MRNDNPFSEYEIESISIPMFFNRSALPHTSEAFTSEFFKMLSSYPKLRLYSGIDARADALLLGTISSAPSLSETVLVEGEKRVQNLVDPQDIGEREDFFTPSRNKLVLTLRVVLIKDPTWEETRLFQSKISKGITRHPKLIFNETIHLSTSFDREFKSQAQGGETNFTNNLGILNKALQTLAVQGREHFKEVVINAF